MKKGFTLIELLAVIIVLAIVALIATPIVLNVIEDSKKSAGESEANLILSGLTTYCQTEDSKVQMGTLDGDRKCSDNMSEAVIKELVPNISSTTKIEEVKYKNGKIISLKVESNGHKFELNENGSMVNKESEIKGIKIATNPTHKLYLFGETFLIDSNTTWQQLIDGSNGKLTSSPYGDWDLLTINGHCLKFFSNGDENGGMPDLYESDLSSKIVSKFGNKSPLDGGDFALGNWSNSIVCPSIPDDGSTYCQVDFEYALEQDSNNVAYIESLS